MGADPAEEEQFGPYLVYERLGVGGMATVHRALERGAEGAERMVALKRLLPHLAEDASFVKSFVREAKLASILSHINIVQTYELGRVGTEYFISMEYIDGRDLRRLLRHARKVTGPPPIHITVGLMIQLADALDYAHHRVDEEGHPLGLVHRDVSPSNVLVTSAGHLKVIDFGIAKAQSSALRTQTGRVKGKLAYMAPEAITARDLDARSDIWAAGVILHELLTARPLFASKNEYQTLLKVQRGDILPPSTFNQACPPELDAVVFKALARDPDQRYRSSGDLREELHGVRELYALQTGYRDIAEWIEWAFSLEMPPSFSGKDTTGVSDIAPLPVTPKPKLRPTPRPRNKDEEDAVEIAWGTGEAEDPGDPNDLLDEVPDVSAKHLSVTRADLEQGDLSGAAPSSKVEVSFEPEPSSAAVAAALARGTNLPVARGTGAVPTQRRTPSEPRNDRAPTVRQGTGPRPTGMIPTVRDEDGLPRRPTDRVPAQRQSDRLPTQRQSDRVPVQRQSDRLATQPAPAPAPQRTTAPGIAVPRRTPASPFDVPPAPGFEAKTSADGPLGQAQSTAIDMPALDMPALDLPALDLPGLALDDVAADEAIEIVDPAPSTRPRTVEPVPVEPSRLSADELFGPEPHAAMTSPALDASATTPHLPAIRPAPSVPVPVLAPPAEPPPDLPPVPVVRFSKTQAAVDADGLPRQTGQRATVGPITGQLATVGPITGQLAAQRGDPTRPGPTSPPLAPPRAKRTSLTPTAAGAVAQTVKPTVTPPRRGFVILAGAAIVIGAAGVAYRLVGHHTTVEPAPASQRMLAPPPAAPGVVKFSIDPADADIVIDHQAAHHGTPYEVSLAAGVHQIEIHHDGYKPWMTRLELSSRETQTLPIRLDKLAPTAPAPSAPATASLSLDTTPHGLAATLDGKPLPTPTPVKLDVPVGPHTIAVLQHGVEVWHESFNAEANSEVEFDPSFTADKTRERAARTQPADSTVATPPPAPVAAPAPIAVHASDVVKVSGGVPDLGGGAPQSIVTKLCIDPTGTVTTAEVLGVDAEATKALQAALRTWRFAPYRRAGVALPACFTLTVHP